MLNIEQIKSSVKQRYPFLLIDRIIDLEEGKRVRGLKNVTINESYFQGHFPDEPIVPAVLIIESIAQLSSFLAGKKGTAYLTSIYKAKFTKKVVPGDQMIIEAEIIKKVRNLIQVTGIVFVDDEKVAKVEMGFMLFKDEEKK